MEWPERGDEIILRLPRYEDIQNLRQQLPKDIAAHLKALLPERAHLGYEIVEDSILNTVLATIVIKDIPERTFYWADHVELYMQGRVTHGQLAEVMGSCYDILDEISDEEIKAIRACYRDLLQAHPAGGGIDWPRVRAAYESAIPAISFKDGQLEDLASQLQIDPMADLTQKEHIKPALLFIDYFRNNYLQLLGEQGRSQVTCFLMLLKGLVQHFRVAVFPAGDDTGKLFAWRLAELYTRAVDILLADLHNPHLQHRAKQQLLEVRPPLAQHLVNTLLTARVSEPPDLCVTLADIIGERGEKVAQDGLIDTFIYVLKVKSGEMHLWQDLCAHTIEAMGKLGLPHALYFLTRAAAYGNLPQPLLPVMARAIDNIARGLALEAYDLEGLKVKVHQSPGTIVRVEGWRFMQLQAVGTRGWREFEEKYYSTWDGHVWNDYRRYIYDLALRGQS